MDVDTAGIASGCMWMASDDGWGTDHPGVEILFCLLAV